ncbi:MAG: hypothetical protein ACTSQD_05760 [Promethearchaeota archaeon]
MSDRITELRTENARLKGQVEDLENKVLSLVGMISLESSGEGKNKELLNDKLIEFINTTTDQLNIVTPRVDRFYSVELKKIVEKGIPILLITGDRSTLDKSYRQFYDDLKKTPGIQILNNPNVKYLLMFNTEKAIYSGGSLDKDVLSSSILIATTIIEKSKIRLIAEIFSAMLPSFMRQ